MMYIERILEDISTELGYLIYYEVFETFTRFYFNVDGCKAEFSFANSFIKETKLLQYYITKRVLDLMEYYCND